MLNSAFYSLTNTNIKTKYEKFENLLRKDQIISIAQLHNYNNSECLKSISKSLKISSYLQ